MSNTAAIEAEIKMNIHCIALNAAMYKTLIREPQATFYQDNIIEHSSYVTDLLNDYWDTVYRPSFWDFDDPKLRVTGIMVYIQCLLALDLSWSEIYADKHVLQIMKSNSPDALAIVHSILIDVEQLGSADPVLTRMLEALTMNPNIGVSMEAVEALVTIKHSSTTAKD